MPDKATIDSATPHCTAHILKAGEPTTCDRPLVWKHAAGAWVCQSHGFQLSMQIAGERVEIGQ